MRRLITFLLGLLVFAWVAYSLYLVGRYGGAVLADLDTTGRTMAVRRGDVVRSALGLTYHGLGGAVLVVAEVLVVLGALACSLRRQPARWRRAGLIVLSGWTALWLGNAVWLESRGWDRPGDVGVLTRAFHEMRWRLYRNQQELRAKREELALANEQLRKQNQQLRRANKILEKLSITDELTRLHNHRFFREQLPREMKRSLRTGEPLSLVLLATPFAE